MKMKLKTGDNVLVITGKDRGKKGKIMRVLRKEQKVVVEKINMRTKHVKKTKTGAGQIIQFEGPIHVSNVMLMSPDGSGPSRIGYKKLASGEKVRVAKRTNETVAEEKVTTKGKKK